MDKENESSITASDVSDYLSVDVGSDVIELQDLSAKKPEFVETVGPLLTTTSLDDELDDANMLRNRRQLVVDGSDADVNTPLIDRQQLKQVKFSDQNAEIEVRELNRRVNDMLEQVDLIRASASEPLRTEIGGDENVESARQSRNQRLREYLSSDNQYIRLLKPTRMKLVCMLITGAILFVTIFLPSCIYSLNYDKVSVSV